MTDNVWAHDGAGRDYTKPYVEAQMRARERTREQKLRRIQEDEQATLAGLHFRAAHRPEKVGSQQEGMLRSLIVGMERRIEDRRLILAKLEASRMTQDGAAEAVATMLLALAPWTGTATDLMPYMRPAGAPSAPHLGVWVRRSSVALAAAGVCVRFHRKAGTGRRLIEAGVSEHYAREE